MDETGQEKVPGNNGKCVRVVGEMDKVKWKMLLRCGRSVVAAALPSSRQKAFFHNCLRLFYSHQQTGR